jgi:ABC-type lipopolysaccharide export system ATPase subunit
MNIKSKIKFYIHSGFNETDATSLAIDDAQIAINNMDEKLNKALDFLTVEQVKEIYGDLTE